MTADKNGEIGRKSAARPRRPALRVPETELGSSRRIPGIRPTPALRVRRVPLQLSLFDLPTLCCSCSRLLRRNGRWTQHAVLAHDYPNLDFSHGLCPSCLRRLYPGVIDSPAARPELAL
jgi:hypothetical protein